MKKISLTALVVASSLSINTMAHDNSSKEQCQYDVDYNIKVNEQQITLTHPKKETITFEQGQLLIDGKSVSLSDKQRVASNDIQSRTRVLIPKIADVAVEGAELGIKAATMVFTALGGASAEEQKELMKPLDKISEKIRNNINHKTFNNQTLTDSFDKELEDEIEKFVGKAISQFSGQMVSQVLGSLFSGDDEKNEEMKDFEFRMENLEHDIETYVESNAKELEVKAEALCGDLEKLAELDLVLESVDGYPKNGIIHEGKGHSFHINRFSLSSD